MSKLPSPAFAAEAAGAAATAADAAVGVADAAVAAAGAVVGLAHVAAHAADAADAADAATAGPQQAFGPEARAAVYRAILERRDMRHFSGGSVDPATLRRLLSAAHHAPSVGFMQPWRFIRVQDRGLRLQLQAAVERERLETARALGQREEEFMRLKVEGLLESAELLAVCLADGRERHVFGRRTLPQMDLASASCAIQNLWLAARAEGLGMGWVSLFDPAEVAALLGLPPGAEPIALLCLGPVQEFYDQPMLQQQGWTRRQPLGELVFDEGWGQPSALFDPVDPLDSSASADLAASPAAGSSGQGQRA